jgi:hypothetical protein
MRHLFLVLVFSALHLGCVQVDGIWYLTFGFADEPECEATISENYAFGQPPDAPEPPDSPWTIEVMEDASPGTGFAQIVPLEDGTSLLIFAGATYVGTGDGAAWTFEWERFEVNDSSQVHESGYRFTEMSLGSVMYTIDIEIDGSSAEGSLQIRSAEENRWTESDDWDPDEVGIFNTQVPSGSYLWDGDGMSIWNYPQDSDCKSDTCELSITSECSSSAPLHGILTKYADEDVFESVDGAGWAPGL